jgi:hypothetical protein
MAEELLDTMTNDYEFVAVDKDTARHVLEEAGLRPATMSRNDDNTFTVSFDKLPTPVVKEDLLKAHENIVIVKRDDDVQQNRKPNVEPQIASLLHFGFTGQPD